MSAAHSQLVPQSLDTGQGGRDLCCQFLYFFKVLAIKPRFLYLLGKCFTSEPHPTVPLSLSFVCGPVRILNY